MPVFRALFSLESGSQEIVRVIEKTYRLPQVSCTRVQSQGLHSCSQTKASNFFTSFLSPISGVLREELEASRRLVSGRVYSLCRFVSTGTIEEKIFQRQLSKEGLQNIVDDKEEVSWQYMRTSTWTRFQTGGQASR